MSRKTWPRCSAATKDGTQCGRRVKDDSIPPLCHIHQLQQQGRSASPLTEPAEIDEVKILKRLARDPKPEVRLRAVDLLLSLKPKGAPKRDEDEWAFLNGYATADQLNRLWAALSVCEAVTNEIRAFVQAGGQPQPERVMREFIASLTPEVPKTPVTTATVEPPPVAAVPSTTAVEIDGVLYLDGVDG